MVEDASRYFVGVELGEGFCRRLDGFFKVFMEVIFFTGIWIANIQRLPCSDFVISKDPVAQW